MPRFGGSVEAGPRQFTPEEEALRDAEEAQAPLDRADKQKIIKKQGFIDEGVSRISVLVPGLDSFEAIKAYAAMWVTNPPPSPTANQTKAKDTYNFVKNTALPKLAGMANTNRTAIDAVTPANSDPFGDGTVWP